ncbi:hypothetical protein V5799_023834 [Amblyomma americanum]|uniref:Uncharacterized protein n=1 Tax=Amblyomma americanum TaxID=6943 RepID=A0AAQ4FGP6_AMBAM
MRATESRDRRRSRFAYTAGGTRRRRGRTGKKKKKGISPGEGGTPAASELISQWEALVRELQGRSSSSSYAGGGPTKGSHDEQPSPKVVPSEAEVLQSISTLRKELSSLTALVSQPDPMAAEGGCSRPSCDFQAVEKRAQELKLLGHPFYVLAPVDASGAKLTELQKMQSEWKTHKDAPPECPDAAKASALIRSSPPHAFHWNKNKSFRTSYSGL